MEEEEACVGELLSGSGVPSRDTQAAASRPSSSSESGLELWALGLPRRVMKVSTPFAHFCRTALGVQAASHQGDADPAAALFPCAPPFAFSAAPPIRSPRRSLRARRFAVARIQSWGAMMCGVGGFVCF